MSIGRPDYNLKVIPIPETIGDDEELYSYFQSNQVAAKGIRTMYDYTIPAGYDYYITFLVVSSPNPVTKWVRVQIDDEEWILAYYSNEYNLPISGVSSLKVESGKRIIIQCCNLDTEIAEVNLSIRGYIKIL